MNSNLLNKKEPSSPVAPTSTASNYSFKSQLKNKSDLEYQNELNNPNAESENAVAESLYYASFKNSNDDQQKNVYNFEKITFIEKMSSNTKIKEIGRFADEPIYRMDHLRRGYAIIINNKRFDSKLNMPQRDGTDLDAACVENCFKRLCFDTRLFHNCTADQIKQLMNKYSRKDYTDSDCFVCVIMSHGENGIIYGADKEVELDQIFHPFKFNQTLAGKPKLFFIQACRGDNLMEGIDSNPYEIKYVNKIPMEADFLIVYSTIAGYYSWRNSINGSWFIQSLCEVLNESGKKLEIMQLMTAVNRKVAYYYESNTNDPEMNGKKQIPCVVSMLTKELYLKPKSNFIQPITTFY